MATNGRANNNLVARDEYARWLKGFSGGPGRPVGSRKKLSEAFIRDVQEDWGQSGKEVLRIMREKFPEIYFQCSRVIAQQAGVCAVGEAPPETEAAMTSSV
jgi:hypothetical protein